jgi:hypothetical protein
MSYNIYLYLKIFTYIKKTTKKQTTNYKEQIKCFPLRTPETAQLKIWWLCFY